MDSTLGRQLSGGSRQFRTSLRGRICNRGATH